MTCRLDLLAHGASAATRAARFPDDEGLEASALSAVRAAGARLRSYDRAATSPARAARETAAELGLAAQVDADLRDCNYGRWRGAAMNEVAAREPDAFALWMQDVSSDPHGGESFAEQMARAADWLERRASDEGAMLAVTHASFVRAAIVAALGAGRETFWRIDVAPLRLVKLSGRAGRWNLQALAALGDPS